MREETFTVNLEFGLDLPQASAFSRTVGLFASRISVSKPPDAQAVNGREPNSLFLLTLTKGDRLRVNVEGPDEDRVMLALFDLFNRWDRLAPSLTTAESPQEPQPGAPFAFDPVDSRSPALQFSGAYIIDPSAARAEPLSPAVRSRAAAWENRLNALACPGLSAAALESLVEKSVKRRLEQAAYPRKNAVFLTGFGTTLFDFQKPIDAWLSVLESSRSLRQSKRRREALLRELLEDDLQARLTPPSASARQARRRPKRTASKPAPRFRVSTDGASKRPLLHDAKTGDSWMLKDSHWARRPRAIRAAPDPSAKRSRRPC